MIANLKHHWRLRSDPLQWILEHRPERDRAIVGKTKELVSIGFFKTVPGALRVAAQRQVRGLDGEYGLRQD